MFMHVSPVHLHFMLPPSDTAHTNAHTHNSHYTSAQFPSQTIQSLYTNKQPHNSTAPFSSHMQHQTCIHNKQYTVCSQLSTVYTKIST